MNKKKYCDQFFVVVHCTTMAFLTSQLVFFLFAKPMFYFKSDIMAHDFYKVFKKKTKYKCDWNIIKIIKIFFNGFFFLLRQSRVIVVVIWIWFKTMY